MIIVIIHDQHDTSDISKRMIIVRSEDGALLILLTGEPRKECSATISYVDIDCDVPHIPIYTQTYISYHRILTVVHTYVATSYYAKNKLVRLLV